MQPDDQSNNYWQPEKEVEESDSSVQPSPETSSPTNENPQVQNTNEPVRWQAYEYIESERNFLWFVIFAIVVIGLIAAAIFLLKSWTFAILVVVMAIAVIILIRRPARLLQYTLSPTQGLYIGERLYGFNEFKTFGIIKDNGHNSIMLVPTKRFSPGVSVYFPDEASEKVVDILGARLPMKELKLDIIDIVVKKLRL
jgi:hypothetical protein